MTKTILRKIKMKSIIINFVAAVIVSLSPFAASQESVNLDRMSLDYLQLDDDFTTASGAVIGFTTSFGENQNWVIGASGGSLDLEDVSATADIYQFGIGYASYGENSATVLSVGVGQTNATACYFGCYSDSVSFTFTSIDYIYNATDSIEITAGLDATNVSDSDADVSTTVGLSLGANFYLTQNVAFIVGVGRDNDDVTSAGVGIMYRF